MSDLATRSSALLHPLRAALAAALAAAKRRGVNDKTIDEHQPLVEALTYAATEIAVMDALGAGATEGARRAAAGGELALGCGVAMAEVARACRDRLAHACAAWDDEPQVARAVADLAAPPFYAALEAAGSWERLMALGASVIERQGHVPSEDDELIADVRASVRQFTAKVVAPMAEALHRDDALVPERLLGAMAELGYFGLSVPESYGGTEMGHLAMIVTTEELSRGSLAGAGSLITRPEILAKALLHGGTEAQKRAWLPQLASGAKMVAISVTEPDVGSDVASVRCRAIPGNQDGVDGYHITGAKAWCTFAGRADVIALLARTDPDLAKGAKGLSLFIVEKPAFAGHRFTASQPGGGTIEGAADHTPGYRGMHSFTLAFDKWFVPATNLIGEEAGAGRGFYLQMAGFSAGRLQTGGRACGLMQAALDTTCAYVAARGQFGQPLAAYGLTRANVGKMAARLIAARAITYAAAAAMDQDERAASGLAAQAKLFACDAAVATTQMGQILHGGWGYAEEYAISRYVSDALVLPIFEGVRPILILKVIARGLFGGA